MSDLSKLREGWDRIEQEQTRLLRTLTVQASPKQWMERQQAFERLRREEAPQS